MRLILGKASYAAGEIGTETIFSLECSPCLVPSGMNRLYARIAQLAEQLICNQQVGGSNPLAGSKFIGNLAFQVPTGS